MEDVETVLRGLSEGVWGWSGRRRRSYCVVLFELELELDAAGDGVGYFELGQVLVMIEFGLDS